MFATKGSKILTPKIEARFCTFSHKSELALSWDAKNGPILICPRVEALLDWPSAHLPRGSSLVLGIYQDFWAFLGIAKC